MKNLIYRTLTIATLVLALGVQSASAATISSQMSIGSRGADVSTLQAFLATNSSIYPEGLVTGYFGPLTSRAVANFQMAYGLPSVGRVGPLTLQLLIQLMARGSLDNTSPMIWNKSAQVSGSGHAVVSWNTNEAAYPKVFYGRNPIVMMEVSGPQMTPIITSEFSLGSASLTTTANLNLDNLIPGATYYYVVQSTDAVGNVSVTWPATFVAN